MLSYIFTFIAMYNLFLSINLTNFVSLSATVVIRSISLLFSMNDFRVIGRGPREQRKS